MTRVIPWLDRPGAGTPEAAASGRNAAPVRAKRRRLVALSSDMEDDGGKIGRGARGPDLRSSPPPALEPPLESSMDEGFDRDDKFRMVEDEFLDIAKQFTQHLHAAEYQRLKRVARSQNAVTISSISRPVTVKMPDETRRKVESVTRAKKQAAVVQAMVGKDHQESASDDDLNGNGGAWLGTALHGLMESPRKSAASLTKARKITVLTRAAMGYNKPHSERSLYGSQSSSPGLESFDVNDSKIKRKMQGSSESSSGDDEDLDGPVRSHLHHTYSAPSKLKLTTNPQTMPKVLEGKHQRGKESSSVSNVTTTIHGVERISPRGTTSARELVAKRLEQARLRRIKDEGDYQEKLEIIPTFLS